MLIYFSGSSRQLRQDIVAYRKIISKIRYLGHIIANEWVETAWLREKQPSGHPLLIESIVANAESLILSSEVLIAEASNISTFGVGYEVGLALRSNKPVLLLVRDKDGPTSYATGLRNNLLTYKKYSLENLDKIVEDFIRENTITTKDLRFNFVIDRQLYNHIRGKAFKTRRTKAEVVRDLLMKDMESDR